MLLGKVAAFAIEVSEHRSESSHSRVHVGRLSAWQLWWMPEALPSAMYAVKMADAWWPACVVGTPKLSGPDTTVWSPVPEPKLFQDVMVGLLTGSKHAW